MSEYTEAAAAGIRLQARDMHAVERSYYEVQEAEAAERAGRIAEALDRAAELLREDAEPPYDDVKGKASMLAYRVFCYLNGESPDGKARMAAALEAYEEAVENAG